MTRPGDHRPVRPIVVTGANGQLGFELVRALAPVAPVCGLDRAGLDITDAAAVRATFRELNPIAVVNAAAYTAVDRAECERASALAANALAPGVLAEHAATVGACFIHYSTDYVFDGDATRPYREDDATAPINVYGRSKLDGEHAVLASAGANLVLRCSWVYSARGRNFLRTMQRLARERSVLRIVADQHGSPSWARFIAAATAAILCRVSLDPSQLNERRGVYHLASSGATTWFDFARGILASRLASGSLTLEPIATDEYPTAARRPAYSVLDSSKLCDTFGLVMPSWDTQLAQALEDQSEYAA